MGGLSEAHLQAARTPPNPSTSSLMDAFPAYLVLPLAAFAVFIVMLVLVIRAEQAEARRRSELMRELLARFETAAELEAFLRSDVARSLIPDESGSPEMPTPEDPALGLIKSGIIVLAIGAGFVLAAYSDLRLTTSVLLTLGPGLILAGFLQMRANKSRARRDGTG